MAAQSIGADSLVDMARRACTRYSARITDIGDLRYELIRPMLLKVESPEKLVSSALSLFLSHRLSTNQQRIAVSTRTKFPSDYWPRRRDLAELHKARHSRLATKAPRTERSQELVQSLPQAEEGST
jgi:hypothetical protein